jgi:selenocysteine-specific elongation factor
MVEGGDLIALSAGSLTGRTVVMQASAFARARSRAVVFLGAYHADHPLLLGARREELGAALGVRGQRALDDLVHALAARGAIRVDGATVALPDFAIELSPEDRARAAAFLAAARAEPYSPPAPSGFGVGEAVLGALAVLGEVVRVSDQIAYPAEVFAAIRDGVTDWLDREGSITMAEYRDRFGTSRKYAQATLEHLDDLRVTRRKGDVRVRYRGHGAAG